MMVSIGPVPGLAGFGGGGGGAPPTPAKSCCATSTAVRRGSAGVWSGIVFGVRARNNGLVRKRNGAVILQERLLCSSLTRRRRLAVSILLALAAELIIRFSAA